jgi:DNA-binding transcriptional LysR family regulator
MHSVGVVLPKRKHRFRPDLQSGVVDASTRRLRYFVAVAEELHFSRAAARLFVAQQALSKQIRSLEDDLGTMLLKRNTRTVELTPAGQAFLDASRDLLASFDASVAAARRIGRGERDTLSLGFLVTAALELTTPLLTEFQRRYPEVRVDLREFSLLDPSAGLADGSSEMAIIRLPISVADLQTEPLFTEPRVVALATGHPLAARDRLTVAELLNEPVTIGRSGDAAWRDFWTLAAYRAGRPPRLIETTSHAQEMEIVATGQGCSITAACAARMTPRAGVRFIPIADIPGVTCALGWRSGTSALLIEQFVTVAREIRDRETAIIRAIERPRLSHRSRRPRPAAAS